MVRLALTLYCFVAFALQVFAEQPPTWQEFEATSPNRKFVARITSIGKGDPWKRKWKLSVYADGAKQKLLWSKPFKQTGFAEQGLLTDDGKIFVYVEDYYRHDTPQVQIYKRSGLTTIEGREFQIDPPKLKESGTRRLWLHEEGEAISLKSDFTLHLKTIDGNTQIIDLKTGAHKTQK